MRDGFIKVAAGTPQIRVADCRYNAEQIFTLMREADKQGVRVLALPELCLTGYTCGDLFLQDTLLRGAEEGLATILEATKHLDLLAAVGLPVRHQNKLYNCAAVLHRGEILALVPKTYLPTYGEFYEKRWFEPAGPGDRLFSFCGQEVYLGSDVIFPCESMPGLTVGVEICEDLWASTPPSVALAEAGATVILNLSASDELVGKAEYRRRLTTFRSNADSRVITVPFALEPCTTTLTRHVNPLPFVPEDGAECSEHCDEIILLAALGLKKRMEHSGAQAAVVGLSGGLDSTLAILITSVAMRLMDRPASDMIAVTMPCFGTTERTRDNAVELAERLGATLRRIDIGAAVRQHFKDIGQSMDDHDVTFENSQARERTQVLMDVANQCGGLVVGTGDLSELALGWATYNGDHMSMYSVNASIPKTLVRRLVSYVAGDKAEEDEALSHVLSDILDTPVSPELLPAIEGQIAQKTEDLVGPYELHDFFLYYAIRWAFPPRKVLRLAEHAFGRTYPRAVVLQWLRTFYRRFCAQQFKRSCLPDGPKVGSVSLSPRGDWRMPSDAVAALWLEELEGLE